MEEEIYDVKIVARNHDDALIHEITFTADPGQELATIIDRISDTIRTAPKFISDKKARKEISDFILSEKKKGNTHIDALKIHHDLDLPFKQITKILKEFEEEGKLKQ